MYKIGTRYCCLLMEVNKYHGIIHQPDRKWRQTHIQPCSWAIAIIWSSKNCLGPFAESWPPCWKPQPWQRLISLSQGSIDRCLMYLKAWEYRRHLKLWPIYHSVCMALKPVSWCVSQAQAIFRPVEVITRTNGCKYLLWEEENEPWQSPAILTLHFPARRNVKERETSAPFSFSIRTQKGLVIFF